MDEAGLKECGSWLGAVGFLTESQAMLSHHQPPLLTRAQQKCVLPTGSLYPEKRAGPPEPDSSSGEPLNIPGSRLRGTEKRPSA